MESRLTAGAVERILNNQQVDKPVLQVLNFKPISSNTADRYRLLLSDGVQCHTYAMLGTQLNGMINNNEIDKFAVVQLDKYMCNVVSPDKKVLIVLDLTVIAKGSTVGCRLGNPVIPTSSSTGAAQPADGGANRPTFQPNGGHVPPSAAPSFGNRASYPASTSDVVVVPIASLTPYQNRWTIRVRVTNKSNIRTWSNSKGEGKLFSMDLLDESGEIRATAFNAECDRLYDVVEVNKVYYISRAVIKNVRKGYSYSSIKNDFEMSFIPETTITPCDDVTPNIPTLQFNFVPISRLQEIGKDSVIDVIGVCKSAGDLQTVTRRTTNQELKKRDVNLVDRSGTEVSLTLWGDQAEKFDGSDNPVVAVKGARVSDFSGVSLSLISSSMLQVNPDIPESHALIGWYSREGTLLQTRSLSTRSGGPMGGNTNWKSIAQAKAEGLGQGDKPDYYSVKACVSIIRKENCLYKACPSENCNKKVVDLQNGYYRCEKCAQETMDFKWRLLVSANLTDFSDGQWVTCFGKEAEMLIGASAEDLGEMYSMSSKEDSRYEDILNEVPFKPFIFRLRTKMEVYNDESRLKTSVMSVAPVNYVEYTQKLLKDIAELNKSL